MSKQEFWLIVAFLIARLVGMTVMAGLTVVMIFKFIDSLGPETNDALTVLLGGAILAVVGSASLLAAALSRDITEYLERMRSRGD